MDQQIAPRVERVLAVMVEGEEGILAGGRTQS